MKQSINGETIRRLREKKGYTQSALARILNVTDKAVSKWETGKGLPDLSLIEPRASALGVSVSELMNGERVENGNRGGNMLRSHFCICPICGNVIHSIGKALVSCCGVLLTPMQGREPDEEHRVSLQPVEDEMLITFRHPMTKEHFISFVAFLSDDGCQMKKLYPEGSSEIRMTMRGSGYLVYGCSSHGLMRVRVRAGNRERTLRI